MNCFWGQPQTGRLAGRGPGLRWGRPVVHNHLFWAGSSGTRRGVRRVEE